MKKGASTAVEFIMPGFAAGSHNKETVMVVIRLARGGAKKRPFFNIVVADARTRRDGRFLERVGFYNPVAAGGEQPLRVAFDRIEHWTGHGAQMSPTVARLVDRAKAAA
jgi:small subunit ribosomal protein S16